MQRTSEVLEDNTIKLPHAGVSAVRLRPDGRVVGVCGWDGQLRLFDWRRFPTPLAVVSSHEGSAYCIDFARTNTAGVLKRSGVLATGGKDGRIVVHALFPT